jgi:hypothetical protein
MGRHRRRPSAGQESGFSTSLLDALRTRALGSIGAVQLGQYPHNHQACPDHEQGLELETHDPISAREPDNAGNQAGEHPRRSSEIPNPCE